jgi:hypothetical protein
LDALQKKLFLALTREIHTFGVAEERQVLLDKPRVLIRYAERDQWVVECLAAWFKKEVPRFLSNSVMSYQKGRGPHLAIQKVQKFLKQYYRLHPHGSLYILKADVTHYTDSIPLTDDSHLWKSLRKVVDASEYAQSTLYHNIRNALMVATQINPKPSQGIPMGSHLTPWIANLYLSEFDRWAGSFSHDREKKLPVIYFRYGDDLLWVTSEVSVAEQIQKTWASQLHQYGLTLNAEKVEFIRLNSKGAGADQQMTSELSWKNQSHFIYLGRQINAQGLIELSGAKRSVLLKQFRKRCYHIRSSASGLGLSHSDLLKAYFKIFKSQEIKTWASDFKSIEQLREITHPGTLRSLKIDFLREIARIHSGHTSGFYIRKIQREVDSF